MKVSVCGDGHWTAAEYCEDGNLVNDDGCTSGCVTCDESIGEARRPGPDGSCWSRHDAPMPWARAQQACAAQGGYLATLNVPRDQPDLAALFAGAPARYWVGLSLAGQPRALVWITGAPLGAADFHAEGTPAPGPGRDCASLSPVPEPGTSDAGLRLGLEDCSNERPFVCLTPPWRVRRATSHAYRVAYGRFSWDEAEQRCQQMAAHLATLTDAEEAAFVLPLIHGPLWIGAHDQQTEGRFAWVTGEPFRFAAFGPNQPDNNGEQDCLVVEPDGRWYDRACAARYPALCELD